MSDVFQRIEAHVVSIGEFLERARRYRPLAKDAARLYREAGRVTARVRQASRAGQAERAEGLEDEISSIVEASRAVLDAFLSGPAYRALLSSLDQQDAAESARLLADVFVDIEPATAKGELFFPLAAKRGEGVLEPEAAAESVSRIAREGLTPQPGPGVGGDAHVHPIRFYEGMVGIDAAILLIVAGEDIAPPTFRAPELGEVLVYTQRLVVPITVGVRRESPDDWLEVRAGGYPQYRERCRELLAARGFAIRDV